MPRPIPRPEPVTRATFPERVLNGADDGVGVADMLLDVESSIIIYLKCGM